MNMLARVLERPTNLQAAIRLSLLLACLVVTGSLIWKMLFSNSANRWGNTTATWRTSGLTGLPPREPNQTSLPPAAGPEQDGKSPRPLADLTAVGANAPLLPPDHPLMAAFPIPPSQISPMTNNPKSMADLIFALSDHEIRLSLLEQGIDQWQTRRSPR